MNLNKNIAHPIIFVDIFIHRVFGEKLHMGVSYLI